MLGGKMDEKIRERVYELTKMAYDKNNDEKTRTKAGIEVIMHCMNNDLREIVRQIANDEKMPEAVRERARECVRSAPGDEISRRIARGTYDELADMVMDESLPASARENALEALKMRIANLEKKGGQLSITKTTRPGYEDIAPPRKFLKATGAKCCAMPQPQKTINGLKK
jgi:uncharacterized protein (UPF0147 family)